MMTCPECDAKEPYSTVKCECGYVFPPDTRKKEERRFAHRPKAEPETATVRYPALRMMAKIYRAFAAFALLLGGVRIVMELRALFDADATTDAKALASGLVVARDVLVTGIAVVTCYAVAEVIHLLLELSDRSAHTAASR